MVSGLFLLSLLSKEVNCWLVLRVVSFLVGVVYFFFCSGVLIGVVFCLINVIGFLLLWCGFLFFWCLLLEEVVFFILWWEFVGLFLCFLGWGFLFVCCLFGLKLGFLWILIRLILCDFFECFINYSIKFGE